MNWLLYCRAGFEGECAQELDAWAAQHGLSGFARAERGSGFVRYSLHAHDADSSGLRMPDWRELIFARQILREIAEVKGLPANDRLTPLLAVLPDDARYCDLWVEAPDSVEGEQLAALCRSFESAAVQVLKRSKRLIATAHERLHLCFVAGDRAIVACADPQHAAPWPQGIVRLKFPREAPSRSTLKLDEAFQTLLNDSERARWLRAGMSAVDLGAAPGGWTYQLVRRSIRVTAIDNGPLDGALLQSGLVDHVRADGFRYRPPQPVDWLVCDMVEQPSRVAELMAEWLAEKLCRAAVFNLKLPMKKRWAETQSCLDRIATRVDSAGVVVQLRARQLYHDREEVTVVALPAKG